MKISRRSLITGSAAALGSTALFWKNNRAWSLPNQAKRIIFFYFPDGIVGTIVVQIFVTISICYHTNK